MKIDFVNVFSFYEVHYVCHSCYLDEFGDFVSDNSDEVYSCDGGRLMKIITCLIADCFLVDFSYDNGTLFVEHFNPDNGTGADYKITIKEVVKNN